MNRRGRRARLDDIAKIAETLRATGDDHAAEAPDLTAAILSRVDAQRPFLGGRTRRLIWVVRGSAAASVVLSVLGVTLAYRWAPETMSVLDTRPAPLSEVVATVQTEAHQNLVSLRQTLDSVADARPMRLEQVVAAVASSSPQQMPGAGFVGPLPPPAPLMAREVRVRSAISELLQMDSAAQASATPVSWPAPAVSEPVFLSEVSPLFLGRDPGVTITPK